MQVAHRRAQHLHRDFVGFFFRIARNRERVAQRHHHVRRRVVRDENCGEVLIVGSSPMKRTIEGRAAADFFRRHALDVLVVLVRDPTGGVEGGSRLIPKTGRPRRQRGKRAALVGCAGFHFDNVGLVEAEGFADRQILAGVFEGDRRRRGELALFGGDVEGRVHFVAQVRVIGPERERVARLRGRCGVHQIERPVTGFVVELFENPGPHLGAAIGERDAIKVVFDYGFGLAGRLLDGSAAGCSRRGRR